MILSFSRGRILCDEVKFIGVTEYLHQCNGQHSAGDVNRFCPVGYSSPVSLGKGL